MSVVADALWVLVALWIAVSVLVTVAYGLTVAYRWLRPATQPKGWNMPEPMPERYPDCITCEALDVRSCLKLMVRHQSYDHPGGVRW